MTTLDSNSISLDRRGAGPPLVLLHCLGVDHHFWDFANELARDFTLISYDLPGHGRSPVPSGAYTIEDLSAQLRDLLARHNIARAHIAGISLGGPPTLVICGDDDIPSFLDAARWLEGNIKGAQLAWLAKARHASAIERPAEALVLIRKFLGSAIRA